MRQSSGFFGRLADMLTRPAVRLCLAGVATISLGLVTRDVVPLLVLVVLGVTAAGMLGVLLTLAGYDADVDDLAARLVEGDIERRLVARWMARARWARFLGGVAGITVWLLAFQTNADLLVWGSLGICAGGVFAEAHHLRRPARPRTARLEARSVEAYLTRRDAGRMAAVGVGAVAIVAVGLATGADPRVVGWAAAAIGTLGFVHLAQRRVASRGRPAVSDELRRADDIARSLAVGNGLARPATYASLAMVARALFELGDRVPAAAVLGLAAWLYGAGLWWRNRRLGLGDLVPATTASPTPTHLATT